jgi:hypothetical protein
MKILVLALALGIAAAPKALAAETKALQLAPKAALAAAPAHGYAPFVAPAPEPELDLMPHRGARHADSPSSCESERALCYDAGSGRIVYRPARQYMPEIPGLQRENISLKRDKIMLRYSF